MSKRALTAVSSVALLIGLAAAGGTAAVWVTSDSIQSPLSITTGNLDVRLGGQPEVLNISADLDAPVPVEFETLILEPHDVLLAKYPLNIDLVGTTLAGELKSTVKTSGTTSGGFFISDDDVLVSAGIDGELRTGGHKITPLGQHSITPITTSKVYLYVVLNGPATMPDISSTETLDLHLQLDQVRPGANS